MEKALEAFQELLKTAGPIGTAIFLLLVVLPLGMIFILYKMNMKQQEDIAQKLTNLLDGQNEIFATQKEMSGVVTGFLQVLKIFVVNEGSDK